MNWSEFTIEELQDALQVAKRDPMKYGPILFELQKVITTRDLMRDLTFELQGAEKASEGA